MTNADPFDLERFVSAQEPVYREALAEIRGGRKRTHWMWFVFPQAAGLGTSDMSRRYGIRAHPRARRGFGLTAGGVAARASTSVIGSMRVTPRAASRETVRRSGRA